MDKYTPVVLIASSDIAGVSTNEQQIKQMKMALSRGLVLTATILVRDDWAKNAPIIISGKNNQCGNSGT